jgi:hypothetical protein
MIQVGYEERIDLAQLRDKRVGKAQAEREAAELDALLVWKDENVRYLSELRPQLIAGKSTALNGALLSPDARRCCSARAASATASTRRCRGSKRVTRSRSSRTAT